MKKLLVILCAFFMLSGKKSTAQEHRYEGKPKFEAGMTRRFVVWEDKGVFKLRTTTKAMENTFAGSIHAEGGTFNMVKLIRLDKGDKVWISKDKKKPSGFGLQPIRVSTDLISNAMLERYFAASK